MKDRIQHIIKAESLTNLQFAQLIESSPATVTHLLSGRNKPSVEMVANIARAFPHYNLRWLILGEGTIYNKGMEETANTTKAQSPTVLSNELPFGAPEAPSSAISAHTIVVTSEQPQQPANSPEGAPMTTHSSSQAPAVTPEPSPTKLIVCLPDGTFSEYTRK